MPVITWIRHVENPVIKIDVRKPRLNLSLGPFKRSESFGSFIFDPFDLHHPVTLDHNCKTQMVQSILHNSSYSGQLIHLSTFCHDEILAASLARLSTLSLSDGC